MELTKVNKILKIITTTILLASLFFMIRHTLQSPEQISTITQGAGIFGPLVLILLIIVGILFSPIPSVLLIVVAGYLYGPLWGAIYSYIGHLLGANAMFFLGRNLRVAKKSKRIKKYRALAQENKNILYLFYIIPLVPITITTIIASRIKISYKKFVEITSISFLPAVIVFSFLGKSINYTSLIELGIIALFGAIGAYILIKTINKNRVQTFLNSKNSKIPKINNF